MITINLYTNNSDEMYINKKITAIKTLSGELVKGSSLIDVNILIEEDNVDIITSCNYIYIPSFKRYYYVNDIASVRTGMWELACHVDVLMSYKDSILATEAIIAKNENEYNLMLNDSSLMSYSNPIITTKKFPNGFGEDGYDLVLTVLGGPGTPSTPVEIDPNTGLPVV